MKIIQITDMHLVPPGERLYGLYPSQRLEQCVRHVNEHHPDAALCMLTGDLVNDGTEAEYRELERILAQLAMPYRLLVGNHDERTNLLKVFNRLRTEPDGFLQSVLDTPEARLITLDTLEPGQEWGRLCAVRLDWAEQRIREARGLVYIFMHHPPVTIQHKAMDAMRLREAESFLGMLRRHRHKVKHVFFGHVHRPYFTLVDGIGFSSLPGTNHQVSLVGMETGELLASYEPPCYGIIFITDEALSFHYQCFLEIPVFPFS